MPPPRPVGCARVDRGDGGVPACRGEALRAGPRPNSLHVIPCNERRQRLWRPPRAHGWGAGKRHGRVPRLPPHRSPHRRAHPCAHRAPHHRSDANRSDPHRAMDRLFWPVSCSGAGTAGPRLARYDHAPGAVAQLAKAPVSKTGDSRFESWLPRTRLESHFSAVSQRSSSSETTARSNASSAERRRRYGETVTRWTSPQTQGTWIGRVSLAGSLSTFRRLSLPVGLQPNEITQP